MYVGDAGKIQHMPKASTRNKRMLVVRMANLSGSPGTDYGPPEEEPIIISCSERLGERSICR
jgi:hypothetical protein